MNILFITLIDIKDINEKGIYQDLLREFQKRGHNLYILSPSERRGNLPTRIIKSYGADILKVKIGNIQKTNIIEKGITTLCLEKSFENAVRKYFSDIKFDLVIYSTPPITFAKVIEFIKKRDNAKTYLLLKDIFPQNAVDIGFIKKSGIMSVIYKIFRKKEKALYALSDRIGCMSQANVDYLLTHNDIDKKKVHVAPNSIDISGNENYKADDNEALRKKMQIRKKYLLPQTARIFIYGGNLGKPQDIPFIIKCLEQNKNKDGCFFIICGTGTDYPVLKKYIDNEKPENILLINGLPRDEYDEVSSCADAGLIFLDSRFTIPNFPSRLLSYMQQRLAVIACTDKSTDIGKIIEDGRFGTSCVSDDAAAFTGIIDKYIKMSGEDISEMGKNAFDYLSKNYTSEKSYEIIMREITKNAN